MQIRSKGMEEVGGHVGGLQPHAGSVCSHLPATCRALRTCTQLRYASASSNPASSQPSRSAGTSPGARMTHLHGDGGGRGRGTAPAGRHTHSATALQRYGAALPPGCMAFVGRAHTASASQKASSNFRNSLLKEPWPSASNTCVWLAGSWGSNSTLPFCKQTHTRQHSCIGARRGRGFVWAAQQA